MRSKLLLLMTVFMTVNCLSQYPAWMPSEFKNKVFCGEFDCYGTMNFNKVPYEMLISEEGIQIKINPGSKFGRNEWGETIKVKYKTSEIWQSPKYSFFKIYRIDLTSSNETKDSPLHPEYSLNFINICVSKYNNQPLSRDQQRDFDAYPIRTSWIEFDVWVPNYGSGGEGKGTWPNAVVCRTVKTSSEIQAEKKKLEEENVKIKKNIDFLLLQKNIVEATNEYNKLDLSGLWNTENNSLYNRIENLRKSNLKELSELISAKKIDEAIVLYKLTGDDTEFLKKIKVLLAEKYAQPDHLMDQTSILSMFQSANIESDLQKCALEEKSSLTLFVHTDGQCQLMHSNEVISQFKTSQSNVSKNIYKEIEFEVEATYKLEVKAMKEKSVMVGLKLNKDMSSKLLPKNDAILRVKFFFSEQKGKKLLLCTSAYDQYSNEKLASTKELKYEGVLDGLIEKEIQISHQCPLMINGIESGKCTFFTKVQDVKAKKLK